MNEFIMSYYSVVSNVDYCCVKLLLFVVRNDVGKIIAVVRVCTCMYLLSLDAHVRREICS